MWGVCYLSRMPFARLAGTLFAVIAAVAVWEAGCAGTPPCARNSDCSEGYCLAGECRQNCIDALLDCPSGYVCNVLSQCESGDASSASVTTGSGTMGSSVSSTGSSVGSAASGGNSSGLLDICSGPNDCGSPLSCQVMSVGGVSRCTRTCVGDADCMTGTRCFDRGGKYCLADDVGRACVAPSSCNFGCLTGPQTCTAACGSGADCPGGYGCQAVGSPPVKVCVKAAAYCAPGESSACVVASACDVSPNLILGGCTLACSSAADCPQRAVPLAPWTCDGLCRRPAGIVGSLPGGYSPVEYHCDANLQPVALCNDGQHLDFDQFTVPNPPAVNCNSDQTTQGVVGDACVDSCRYNGGCSHGFACVGVGSVGAERIGLCFPIGSGEPGTPCSKSRDCAFGYCTAKNVCSRDCTADAVCPTGTACVLGGGPNIEGMPFRRCE